jgi:molybdopterin-guanine dinucleotide biosynthesis protein A
MGADKAGLPYGAGTLIEHVAAEVSAAVGCVTVVGGGERPGLRVIPDLHPGFGPLCGILTALRDTEAEYALVVACDMPWVTAGLLRDLVDAAAATAAGAMVAQDREGRIHPLCACYARGSAAEIESCVDAEVHAVRDALRRLRTMAFPVADARMLANVNTPDEWAKIVEGQG